MQKTSKENITIINEYILSRKNIFSYMIGLFQTDASIRKNSFQLELSSKDSDIIYKLSKELPINHKIKERTRNTNFKLNYKSIILYFSNKFFVETLIENNVFEGKKSNLIKPPNNIILIDYWRGVIDGDGSLGFRKSGKISNPFVSLVSASSDLIDCYLDFLHVNLNKKFTCNRNKRDNVYNILVQRTDAKIISNILYYDNCFAIDRKINLSNQIKQWDGIYKIKSN